MGPSPSFAACVTHAAHFGTSSFRHSFFVSCVVWLFGFEVFEHGLCRVDQYAVERAAFDFPKGKILSYVQGATAAGGNVIQRYTELGGK